MSDSHLSLIRTFLIDQLYVDPADLARSRDLLEEGVIDSLGLMVLVEYLQQQRAIEFDPEEIVHANFRTIESIADLVRAKEATNK